MWVFSICILLFVETESIAGQSCPTPDFSGNTYTIVDLAPTKAVVKVAISPTANSNEGWSVIVIFSRALDDDVTIASHSAELSAISSNRRAWTFINRDHNKDISTRMEYGFTFQVEGSNLNSKLNSISGALVGFYDTQISDGSCFLDPNTIDPLPFTTSTATTTATTTSSTTSSSTTTTTASTTTSAATGLPEDATQITFTIINSGWSNGENWNFQFRYEAPVGEYIDWTIKLVFSEEVVEIEPYEANPDGPHSDGKVWFLTPKTWNEVVSNGQVVGTATAVTTAGSAPCAIALLYNNNDTPSPELISTTGCGDVATTTTTTTSSTTTTTTASTSSDSTVSTASTNAVTLNPNGPSGVLPESSSQTMPNYTPSQEYTAGSSPFDYNEILHKSILFYEAQRSGTLPSDNRIPWRGDSGLKDGCVSGTCVVDLTGGWFDAGDHVKFGFPMAWSTTVLAWGMIEFSSAYEDAMEWSNALNMLKWATDYFLKAHVSGNELYFQVGDPQADHMSWGHPETMTMERPIYKVDTNHPGTEVAAETAAALAASSLVFRETDSTYANNLLSHAIQLYDFAQAYKGNYHETVSESNVANFYQSFSGYRDELMWAAMWLYKATDDQMYLNYAISEVDFVGTAEFSWDQKGPGALVLLAQENSQYISKLNDALNVVMSKEKTPGGLTYFSQWGTNRYAANYALIAIMTAKLEGLDTSEGSAHFEYGKGQIHRMLGAGDGAQSYVVGFGTNAPERPHHRSSSCRRWTASSSKDCDWQDYNADASNPQILYGALVGGPGQNGVYVDDRKNFQTNEVALDYNAGFQSAVAGLKYSEVLNRA